jgi:phosphoribosylformylglycinamidine cyclo-ligase
VSGLSYRDTGVDVAAAERFLTAIEPLVRSTHGPEVVHHPSRFAGLVRLPGGTSIAAATCDGVGTKTRHARAATDYEGLGIDLVAMSVNDLLPLRARPLLFLDYLGSGRLDPARLQAAVRGIVAACRRGHCALVGGETAELPGTYPEGTVDMVGFAVGLVDESDLPDPSSMAPGDVVVALPSTGLHANGFSLARAALFIHGGLDAESPFPGSDLTLGDVLLTPTAIYVDEVLTLMDRARVKSAAHVTGGGLLGRARAMLEPGLAMRLDPDAYEIPEIVELVRTTAGVPWSEMASTFNMGLGFLAVVPEGDAAAGEEAGWMRVGEITAGAGEVDLGYA